MKQLAVLCAFVFLWGCKEQKPEEPSIAETMKTYTIEQMMDNESIGGGSFSPDKSKMLIASNRSGIYNMYTVATKGGEILPITQSDSASVFGISYFPKDERMLFRMDGNGDEIYHIYLRDTDGSHKDLTPDEGKRASFYGWTDDKKGFFYTSNKRDERFTDLYEMDLETFTPKLLVQQLCRRACILQDPDHVRDAGMTKMTEEAPDGRVQARGPRTLERISSSRAMTTSSSSSSPSSSPP